MTSVTKEKNLVDLYEKCAMQNRGKKKAQRILDVRKESSTVQLRVPRASGTALKNQRRKKKRQGKEVTERELGNELSRNRNC